MSFEYENELELCIEIAKAGGKLISDVFHSKKSVSLKTSATDLVTETDKLVEKTIFNKIEEVYPDHVRIGEETSSESSSFIELTDKPTWVVDPIDGTTNFVHSFPFCCVAIGFMKNKQVQFGVVFNPVTDELYVGRKGFGAELNGVKIEVNKGIDFENNTVQNSLIITDVWTNDEFIKTRDFKNIRKLIEAGAHGIRSIGSAALALCLVASGKADGFYQHGVHIWDYCGAGLILQEAGGVIIDTTGGELDFCGRRCIGASCIELAKGISEVLETFELKRD